MSEGKRGDDDGRGRGVTAKAGLRALERDRNRPAAPRELVQLAAFTVGGEAYALDIMRIKEIINPLPITRVPKSPPFIEGVIELRGAILPVVDMRKRFDQPPAAQDRATKYLIVAIEGVAGVRWIVGLIVDKVLEVMRIPRDDVRPAPAIALDETARYFSGVCRHRDRILMVIDLDAILSSSERITLAGISQDPRIAAASGMAADLSAPGKS